MVRGIRYFYTAWVGIVGKMLSASEGEIDSCLSVLVEISASAIFLIILKFWVGEGVFFYDSIWWIFTGAGRAFNGLDIHYMVTVGCFCIYDSLSTVFSGLSTICLLNSGVVK